MKLVRWKFGPFGKFIKLQKVESNKTYYIAIIAAHNTIWIILLLSTTIFNFLQSFQVWSYFEMKIKCLC